MKQQWIMAQGQHQQKLARPYFKNESGMAVHGFKPSHSKGGGRRVIV
jgi:hypothetical protein